MEMMTITHIIIIVLLLVIIAMLFMHNKKSLTSENFASCNNSNDKKIVKQ